ncbi:hypothetical protein FHS18_004025 [Paenibacillus phyllosphaerae]|uniref:Uncharacterized protein n=1 Tax=Paenibacillus phyllosphaerae TaxID=274593 RepID=A0A7W5FP84_9BACL|nr:hypothetical protein [Paenibacillus phyllosphaerae]MBB3111957.1 hypothetical protein [Paenibacillus phyllosphaerae]
MPFKLYTPKELYKQSFSKNPLFDFVKFEGYMSLIFTVIITIIIYTLVDSNSDNVGFIVSDTKNIILYASFGLLGMLGFIISGLAIISGTMSNKVTKNIIKENKFKSVLAILYSFNYLGYLIGFFFVFYIFGYFILSINGIFKPYVFIVYCSIAAYGLFFIVFYAVSLLKTCLDIFVINYMYSGEEKETNISKEMSLTDIRIDALTKVLLDNKMLNRETFISQLNVIIDMNVADELQKKRLLKEIAEYYSTE